MNAVYTCLLLLFAVCEIFMLMFCGIVCGNVVYSSDYSPVVGLCFRSLIFGMPGNTKGPLLFMLLCLIFWAYPVYVFKVKRDLLFDTCALHHVAVSFTLLFY